MISLKELANKVNGHLIGDGTIIISTVDDIHSASKESITYAFLPNYKKERSTTNAAAILETSAKATSLFLINLPKQLGCLKLLLLFFVKI